MKTTLAFFLSAWTILAQDILIPRPSTLFVGTNILNQTNAAGVALKLSVPRYVANISDLATASTTAGPSVVVVTNSLTGGEFVARAGGVGWAVNPGTIFTNTDSGNVWVRRAWLETGEVNVKWFGATGNGTTDDTAAINGAITALASGVGYPVAGAPRGLSLLLPKGKYRTTAPINIVPGITMRGVGQESSVIYCDHTGSGILFNMDIGAGWHTTGIQITDLSVIYVEALTPLNTSAGIDIVTYGGVSTSAAVEISNVMVKWAYHGIRMNRVLSCLIKSVQSMSNDGDGFRIHENYTSTSITFTGCYASWNTGHGYSLMGSGYVTFLGCASDANDSGYYVKDGKGISFVGCGAENNRGAGITIYDTSAATDVLGSTRGISIISCHLPSPAPVSEPFSQTTYGSYPIVYGAVAIYGNPDGVVIDAPSNNTGRHIPILPQYIDSTADTFTSPFSTAIATGWPLIYKTNGSDITGLTNGTVYWSIYVSAGTWKLATSYANAIAGTAIDFDATGLGTDEIHFNLNRWGLAIAPGSAPRGLRFENGFLGGQWGVDKYGETMAVNDPTYLRTRNMATGKYALNGQMPAVPTLSALTNMAPTAIGNAVFVADQAAVFRFHPPTVTTNTMLFSDFTYFYGDPGITVSDKGSGVIRMTRSGATTGTLRMIALDGIKSNTWATIKYTAIASQTLTPATWPEWNTTIKYLRAREFSYLSTVWRTFEYTFQSRPMAVYASVGGRATLQPLPVVAAPTGAWIDFTNFTVFKYEKPYAPVSGMIFAVNPLFETEPADHGVWIRAGYRGELVADPTVAHDGDYYSTAAGAVRLRSGSQWISISSPTPDSVTIAAAASTVAVGNASSRIKLVPDADYLLTSTGQLADGTEGQEVTLYVGDAVAHKVTFTDEATHAGSNVKCGTGFTNVVVRAFAPAKFMFSGASWSVLSGERNVTP